MTARHPTARWLELLGLPPLSVGLTNAFGRPYPPTVLCSDESRASSIEDLTNQKQVAVFYGNGHVVRLIVWAPMFYSLGRLQAPIAFGPIEEFYRRVGVDWASKPELWFNGFFGQWKRELYDMIQSVENPPSDCVLRVEARLRRVKGIAA